MNNRKLLTLSIDAKIHRQMSKIKDATGVPVSKTAESFMLSGLRKKEYADVTRQRAKIDAADGSVLDYAAHFNGRKTTIGTMIGSLAGIEAASQSGRSMLSAASTTQRRGEEILGHCNKALLELVGELKSRV